MSVNDLEFLRSVFSILGLLAAPVLVIAALVFIFYRNAKFQERRTQEIRQVAAQNGFNFFGAASYQSIPGYGYFRLFELGGVFGRQIENGFQGTIGGYQVSVFDYRYSESRKTRRLSAVMISSPRINLPWFSLMPQGKGWLQQIQNALEPDINFPSNPVFSANYLLLSHDQAGVRQAFDPGVLAYFEAIGGNDKFVVEGGGNTILFYRYGILAAPNQLRRMVDEGLKIANAFAR